MVTLREYARMCRVSYETIRRKVRDNEDYLAGHITTKNGTRYLDAKGVQIMNAVQGIPEDELESPVDKTEREKELEAKVTSLLEQLNMAKDELLATRRVMDERAERITQLIQEQNEAKVKLLESESRIELIEKEHQARIMVLEMQKDPATIAQQKEQIEQLKNDVGAYQDQAAYYKREAEEAQQRTEAMSRDADEAMHEISEQKRQNDQLAEILAAERQRREELEQEVNSYEKSIFGLFRKKKKK